jgi:signal peptidase I
LAKSDGSKDNRTFFDARFVWTEKRRANRLAFILFWSIVMYYFFTVYVVSLGVVNDISMHPTLPEGAYYMVNKYIYRFAHPERGDIVVFRKDRYTSEEYVKRVIALPGETFSVQGGEVYVNGRRLDEPYAAGRSHPDSAPHTIGKDAYFVLGDNRLMSEDSREFGAVPFTNIMGKIKPGEFFPFR